MRTWYIGDSKFLMLMYDSRFEPGKTMVANQLAIFDAESMAITYVSGLPATDKISSFGNTPYTEEGKTYIAVTTTDSYPTIYVIDNNSAIATKGLTVMATKVGAVGRMIPLL